MKAWWPRNVFGKEFSVFIFSLPIDLLKFNLNIYDGFGVATKSLVGEIVAHLVKTVLWNTSRTSWAAALQCHWSFTCDGCISNKPPVTEL